MNSLWFNGIIGLALALWSIAGLDSFAQTQPPQAQSWLNLRPVQKGVVYSMPTDAEIPNCKVETIQGRTPGSKIILVKDPQGRPLRQFIFGSNDKAPDQSSFFRDGQEVYREVSTKKNGKPDRFLWVNAGGMKIGLDLNQDGFIDQWQAISIEELSQEALRAVADKKWDQYKALLVTEEDLRRIGTPDREIARIRELQKTAQTRFQQSVAKLNHLNEATRWLHVEAGSPSRLLAEATGMKHDVLMYYRAMILCETATKTDYIQLGEIVQIGEAWKLLDAPVNPEAMASGSGFGEDQAQKAGDPEMQSLLERLAQLDKQNADNPSSMAAYQLQRAKLIEEIVRKAPDAERLSWFKQMVDCLASAAQASPANDATALNALKQIAEYVSKTQPGSEAAAHANYRALTVHYAVQSAGVANAQTILDLQNKYLEQLKAFVETYPKAEETHEALWQLGMIHEFQMKEEDAKKWYEQLARVSPSSKQGIKAAGALRRLNVIGQPWELPPGVAMLYGPGLNPAQLRGKTVIVYYWASWVHSSPADLDKLKAMLDGYQGKGLVVVAINVDENRAAADAMVQKLQPAGFQLFSGGGSESPAVLQYGLVVFPNLFIVDGEGRVSARAIEVGNLDETLKKLIK